MSTQFPGPEKEKIEAAVKAIEQRSFEIGGAQVRLQVLSVHPSLAAVEPDEISLRMVLRPIDASERGIVEDNSLVSRLSALGLTYNFDLRVNTTKEVSSLIETIRADVPRALRRSLKDSERTRSLVGVRGIHVIPALAALIMVLVASVILQHRAAESILTVLLVVLAGVVYGIIEARMSRK